MERIILPYGGQPDRPAAGTPAASPAAYVPHIHAHAAHGPGAPPQGQAKGPAEYLRALRRRFWLILLVGGVLAAGGTVLVLRQEPIYRASAQIEIVPPQFDNILANLMADGSVNLSAVTPEQYESNRLAHLRNKHLVDEVLRSPRIGPPVRSEEDPALELIENLRTSQLPRTTRYDVHLEGTDPHRIANILNLWLELYEHESQKDVDDKIANSQAAAQANINKMYKELETDNVLIGQAMASTPHLSPEGENYLIREWEQVGMARLQMQNNLNSLHQQLWLSRIFPKEQAPRFEAEQREIAELMERRRALDLHIGRISRVARNPRDPAATHSMAMQREIDRQIQALQEASLQAATPDRDPADLVFDQYRETLGGELSRLETAEDDIVKRIQDMAPAHNKFNDLLRQRDRTAEAIAGLQEKIDDFNVLSQTQNKPVTVVMSAVPPSKPVRPNYMIMLALVGVMSVGSGVGLVLVLEYLDHSLRAPEQLTTGLTLPLLGVVPRMRRTSRLQRGGHLWTAGTPQSAEADAYRNLRAGLVGLGGPEGRPAVTLLVTSAKAGEGKSTTALNLAATCARSGERTLLLEVDLRRPSLRPVFDEDGHDLGLVDVLRGEMPWQRTVIPTDVPNLDFLPAGDPSGVPVEVLGALEMKQLIAAVSGHYDRVILDGPAILGLADCRMLGRVVDAAVLVVRAGGSDLRPVIRARTMLEQSRAPIVGVVFNGLCEDVNNWSCVASYLDGEGDPDADEAPRGIRGRGRRAAGALASAE